MQSDTESTMHHFVARLYFVMLVGELALGACSSGRTTPPTTTPPPTGAAGQGTAGTGVVGMAGVTGMAGTAGGIGTGGTGGATEMCTPPPPAPTGAGGSSVAGSAGRTGAAGGGAAGMAAAIASSGCMKPSSEATNTYVKHTLTSSGVSRDFYTWLPTGYDPSKPYRTVFEFHPCGASGNPTANVPIQNASKGDAILIAPQSKGNCYENQIRNSPDVTFFDDTLKFAEANYCVDQARVFAIGYSAGSWMSIILGCMRSDVVRAHAQVSGGLPMFIRPGVDCKGSVAALFIHDGMDPTNTILGGIAGRDRALRIDGCGTTTTAWAPSPCMEYQGCKPGYPVVWCQTSGQGHNRQDTLAPNAMWKFFSQF